MRLVLFYFCAVLRMIESSKCPEPKKPHPTSCTVFYNCVNLPSGGYVWVPSKCTQGLVFQPYLRICVLPGDTWTCDTLSTESSLITNKYELPELIDFNETSYMGSAQGSPEFSEFIDSSYTTDEISDTLAQEVPTPYPLIEIEETIKNEKDKNANRMPTIGNHKMDHLYEQDENKNQDSRDKYSLLNRLINHLLIYKEITIPLEFLASSSFSVATRISTSTNPPQLFAKPETVKDNQHSILMNYLIQNYIQQNNLQNTIITGLKPESTFEINKGSAISNSPQNVQHMESTSKIPIDDSEARSNIILVTDNAGNKQYFTVEKYNSVAHQLNAQFARLVPCIKNIRLPNTTDCSRYYTCDPETVIVTEYFCPSNTAFNKYTRMCDAESRSACTENKSKKEDTKLTGSIDNTAVMNVQTKNQCTELGKTKDPSSDSHYFICYSASETSKEIKSIRMSCPNSLIFCQSKKVCTRKQLCKAA